MIKQKFNPKMLKFEFDLSEANYVTDSLQERLLQFYIRADSRFRRAFHTNYTSDFLQYLKDKARLGEPIHLSIMGATRGGKCQKKGSKILMANGEWKNIEDVMIGDEVLSPQKSGKNYFSKVIGVSQYLSNENYDVVEKNGKNKKLYSCSSNHIIPTFFRGTLRIDKKISNVRKANWGYAEKTAKEFFKRKNKSYLLISSFPIEKFKNRKNCKVNPYVLGVYLGDGGFTSTLGITNCNKKLLDECSKIYKPMRIDSRKKVKNEYKQTFTYLYSVYSEFGKLLILYGLRGKKSGEKFIPKEALLSDIGYRRKLLAGLIDTDGTLSKNLSYSITTKSKRLADDILFLVRTLGGNGKISKISKTIKSIKFKGDYYKVGFYLAQEIEKIPLVIKNKMRDLNKSYWKLSANRVSFKLKKSKSSLVYGIEVDSPSKYYITNNFLITHNSSIASTIGFIMMALYKKEFSVDYICGDSIEFLEKIKSMPEEMTKNSYFQMDEQKNLFGIGSMAKKIKLQDVANIIAKHNISTASLCPTKFANQEASYGLRIFGKCYNTKTCRLMLYNLQEGRNSLPLGNVYLPIPSAILPPEIAKKFTDEYEAKKDRWIQKEMMGEGDALSELKRKSAESFMRDKQFLQLKKKNEKIVYISMKLGTDWTKMEIDEIYHISQMLGSGIVFEDK